MRPKQLGWLALILSLATAGAAEPDSEITSAEKVLRDAKVEVTGAGLLQFFQERTLTPTDRTKLADAVKRLGDDDFEVREKAEQELIRAGRKALPFLRPAVKDDDLERARRATRCVEEIES